MSSYEHVPFNRPHAGDGEIEHTRKAIAQGHLSCDGSYSRRCQEWLEAHYGAPVLLVHSCTAALELSAILAGVGPGDEVIMPSYTFVSTANAFVLRGATPVFVDVEPDTLNVDPAAIDAATTDRTRAIVPVHYAGVGCRMDEIGAIADNIGAAVIEDAAQGVMARLEGRPLGALASLGAISFHETKNVTCGEGGALIVADKSYFERAEILREKGTNRSRFARGQVDKYTWVDIGSSFGLSDLAASFLWAQLEHAHEITAKRLAVWHRYHEAFTALERAGLVRRPVVPEGREHNAHMYYLVLRDAAARTRALARLAEREINAVFHYVPLHSSPAGQRFGRTAGSLAHTERLSERLIRLPLWPDMTTDMVDRVTDALDEIVRQSPVRTGV